MQHAGNMASADQRTIHSNTERLLVALDRALRTQMLGIAHLKTDKHPRNRPPTIDAALKRDEIAQGIAVARAVHPEWSDKEVRYRICAFYNIKRSYYYRVLNEVDPERWQNMQGLAAALAEFCTKAT